MRVRLVLQLAVVVIVGATTRNAEAQLSPARASVTVTGGVAGFVDESAIRHTVVGAGATWLLHSHIAVGPEFLYMIGPGSDRDLFVLAVARFAILPFERRIVPMAVVGGGLMTHSDRFGSTAFRSSEGALVLGGGLRVNATRSVYIAPELTIGWEPHLRASVNVGIMLRSGS